MSATMARQGGRVPLEQSNVRLTLNMANMAKGGFSHTAIEDTQYLIGGLCARLRGQGKRGVVFQVHRKLKAAIETHLAMLRQNQMDGRLHSHNATAKNLQTCWRRKETDESPPD